MRAAKAKRKKKNIVLRVAFAVFALYVAVQIVFLQIQLHDKKEELTVLEAEEQSAELLNESLQEKVDDAASNLEEKAHEQGFILPGEQIYEVIPEN